jgi:hypothetical protein
MSIDSIEDMVPVTKFPPVKVKPSRHRQLKIMAAQENRKVWELVEYLLHLGIAEYKKETK